jgi:hypothetical protein
MEELFLQSACTFRLQTTLLVEPLKMGLFVLLQSRLASEVLTAVGKGTAVALLSSVRPLVSSERRAVGKSLGAIW